MYLIDTNVFLRVLVREDEKTYDESLRLLEAIKLGKIKAVVAGLVLVELVWVLRSFYKLSQKEAAGKVRGVLNLKQLKVVDGYDHAWALEQYKHKKVKYIDACLASMPEVRNKEWVVVSYDSDFGKLPCKWMNPGEVVKGV